MRNMRWSSYSLSPSHCSADARSGFRGELLSCVAIEDLGSDATALMFDARDTLTCMAETPLDLSTILREIYTPKC